MAAQPQGQHRAPGAAAAPCAGRRRSREGNLLRLGSFLGVRVKGVQSWLLVPHKTAWLSSSRACYCCSNSNACSASSIGAMNHCCPAGLSRYAMDFQVGGACRARSTLLRSMPDLPQCAAVLKMRFGHVPSGQQSLPDQCRRSGRWARGAMAWWWQPSIGDHNICCIGRPGCEPVHELYVLKRLAC